MTSETSASAKVFRDLYCEAKRCPVQQFERRFFRYGLYRRSLLLGVVVGWLTPSFFEPEFTLVRQLAVATTREEYRAEVEDYHLCDHATLERHILPFLHESDQTTTPVLVHCSGGSGRTGHVLAAWLVRYRSMLPAVGGTAALLVLLLLPGLNTLLIDAVGMGQFHRFWQPLPWPVMGAAGACGFRFVWM